MRTLLAVEQHDLRLALELYLDQEPGVIVVGMASEAASLRALLRTARPDLLLLDWDLPGYAPSNLLIEAKRLGSPPHVILLGKDLKVKQAALDAGADAFVLRGDLPDQLLAAIRHARMLRAAEKRKGE